MSSLSDMLKKVELDFGTEQRQHKEAAVKVQQDEALLKRLTEEQWVVLNSELQTQANDMDQSIHHENGMVQIGGETRLDLRVTRQMREVEKMKAVYSSPNRDRAASEVELVPLVVNGVFQWTAPGMENAGKSSEEMALRLLRGLIEFHAMVLRSPQRSC